MPKVSDEHLEARRQQILAAAARCFGRTGIHGTSMRDIYRESGLSSGAVYHYYASKQEIVDAVFEMGLQSSAQVMEAPSAGADPLAALDGILELVFGMLDRPELVGEQRTSVVIAGEAVRDDHVRAQYKRLYDDMFSRIGALVTGAQRRGQIDARLDPAYVARVLFSTYEGYRVQKLVDPAADTTLFTTTLRALVGFDGTDPSV